MSARTVVEHALTVYYDGNTELVSQLLANLRAEHLNEAADWLASVGEKNAAYLLRTCDVPASAPPVPDNTTGDEGELTRLRRELDSYKDELDSLHRNTLPELRREIQHHQDGKKRWRVRAESAEPQRDELRAERDALQRRLHEAAMAKVWTNEDGKKFVFVDDLTGPLLGITAKAGE
jgi:hypothetical protein